ncbi:Glycine/D-amino acid oxidase [Actinopolyspora alba]|uniref:Glycine/D-amino acid oxidase n=1 Tax=Actinopolyspora alba TaxID=673379 RepID=A0A1I1X113_9ACTN|nr:FAD-dependent oxidoreductase [Actinopolyspora alba]SFE00298.1 Glycine/D-amino acid oxidase [Actinopolyspora alba]
MRVLVIGAGAVGGCAALRLAEAGVEVTLLTQQEPADTLSAHSFGWVNAIDNKHTGYYELSVEALAAHERLAADTVDAPQWSFRKGNLHWGSDEASADAQRLVAERYHELGYPVEGKMPSEVLRDLEPGLSLENVVGPVHFYPNDRHVLGGLMLSAVLARARTAGVRVRSGERVEAVSGSSVRLMSGAEITADAVLCCAGRGNVDLIPDLPLLPPGVPERLTRGLLVRTTPVAEPVTRVIHAPGLSIRPHTGNRLVLHCHDFDRTLTEDPDADALAQRVLARLPHVLPGAAEARVENVFVGVRPMPSDGMSIIGPVPGNDGCYVIATHSGVSLGPVLGEIAAQEVLGTPHPLAEPFRPTRF